ncbi:MAG: hypothetical protein CEE43_02055 [Promethearchaeota archaeon Loki_b32]|nr:MAG: hypothetical protein CEE43_02055 [Candidatus Lokiarchaeota archaeon Loki_b32]
MRSEKWKVLVLKTSKLRRVRTSLKLVLRKAVHEELKDLNHLRDLYRKKQLNGTNIPSQAKREDSLIKETNELLQALSCSTLKCHGGITCKSIEMSKLSHDIATLGEDMVWNPLLKEWICINCYNFYYKTDAQKQHLQDAIRKKKEDDKTFEKWLSSQL